MYRDISQGTAIGSLERDVGFSSAVGVVFVDVGGT